MKGEVNDLEKLVMEILKMDLIASTLSDFQKALVNRKLRRSYSAPDDDYAYEITSCGSGYSPHRH